MLDRFIEDIERQRKRVTVYSVEDETDIVEQLATRNVTIERRQLYPGGLEPFVTIRDDGEFTAAIALDDLQALLTPPVVRPGHREEGSKGYRMVMEVFEETLFSSMDRKQLLATSREIEDRALRTGRGTLRVSFQSLSAFESQIPVYRQLGAETTLEIHIYGKPDWTPPTLENITYHRDADCRLTQFWCLAFDGGDTPAQACALVARERGERFEGFWSYEQTLVSGILATLESIE